MNWSHVTDGDLSPNGFSFSGICAGLKESKKKDLALIVSPDNSICSGMFTQSIVRASCVDLCEERINETSGSIRAILINSGHANACVGEAGIRDSIKATKALSKLLGFQENQVLICSTGVIGVQIPINNLLQNLPNLVHDLDNNKFEDASQAILTTDLCQKIVVLETFIGDRKIKISAMAKGSGMIYPNMATMLGFLTCDCGVEKEIWDGFIKEAVSSSFNAISVDGETSTNDSFIAINAGNSLDTKYLPIIQEGVNYACKFLAKSIARDGEGANCLVEVDVSGAENNSDAIKIARSIVNSSLVKTAIHGSDPNWGRIISAAGNSGVAFNIENLSMSIGNFKILENGSLIEEYEKDKIISYMKSKMNNFQSVDDPLQILIKLNIGNGKGKAWGCDMSKKYVEINSEYTT